MKNGFRPKAGSPSIEALLYQAHKRGVLPISSACGGGCVFCSNRYNPPSCEVIDIPHRTINDLKNTLPWLQSAPGAIIVGESVTRINEGEPLMHPDFLEIMKMVRDRYPRKGIRVTTNALLLEPSVVDELADFGIELVISLNTVGRRESVMGDTDPLKTLRNVEYLGKKMSFEGSAVALPFLTGWSDLAATVRFLKESGGSCTRLLAPGFSSAHPLYAAMPASTWAQMREFAAEQSHLLKFPVVFEPPLLTDLKARVEGVLSGTPAEVAGIRPGDVVKKVAGKTVFSRKECFEAVRFRENPVLTLDRAAVEIEIRLIKPRFTSPGFIMYEDLDYRDWMHWEGQAGFNRGVPWVFTSQLAKGLVQNTLAQRGREAKVFSVESRYFGGNICAAGLLTVTDFLAAFLRNAEGHKLPPTITLPKRAFDPWGRDLEGRSFRDFQERVGIPVVLAG